MKCPFCSFETMSPIPGYELHIMIGHIWYMHVPSLPRNVPELKVALFGHGCQGCRFYNRRTQFIAGVCDDNQEINSVAHRERECKMKMPPLGKRSMFDYHETYLLIVILLLALLCLMEVL